MRIVNWSTTIIPFALNNNCRSTGNHVGDGSTAPAKSPKEQIRDIAEVAKAKTWKRDMARILELVERT